MSVSSYNSSNSRGSWVDSQRGRSPSRGRNSPTLTTQFEIREHMASHYHRLQNVKAAVDTSAPKSHLLRQPRSRSSSLGDRPTSHASSSSSLARTRPVSANHLDGVRCTVNRINYYLEALQNEQKRLLEQVARHPAVTRSSRGSGGSSAASRRPRDLMELHKERFTTDQMPFTPRVLRTDAKSRLRESRVYNEPLRVRRNDATKIRFDDPEEGTMMVRKVSRNGATGELRHGDLRALLETTGRLSKTAPMPSTNLATSRDEDDAKYLEFVVQVTDDVLSRGVFTDSMLTQVFKQHTERRKRDLDANKMDKALEMLKGDLGIGEVKSSLFKPKWDVVVVPASTLPSGAKELTDSSCDSSSKQMVPGVDLVVNGDVDAFSLKDDKVVPPPPTPPSLESNRYVAQPEEETAKAEVEEDFVDERMERLQLDNDNFYNDL